MVNSNAKVQRRMHELAEDFKRIIDRWESDREGTEANDPFQMWSEPMGVRIPVESVDDAKTLIEYLACSDLLSPTVAWNAFGLEERDGDDWCEWYDDETGDDITTVMDREGR